MKGKAKPIVGRSDVDIGLSITVVDRKLRKDVVEADLSLAFSEEVICIKFMLGLQSVYISAKLS